MKLLSAAVLAFLTAAAAAQAPPAVILVTLDGARIEEVFGGLDPSIVQSQLKPGQRLEDQAIYKRYWAATPEAAAREADAVLLGHVDARARIDRGQSRARQPRPPDQSATGSRIRATRRSWSAARTMT